MVRVLWHLEHAGSGSPVTSATQLVTEKHSTKPDVEYHCRLGLFDDEHVASIHDSELVQNRQQRLCS